jgi:H+/Cl- antiporter ClcA
VHMLRSRIWQQCVQALKSLAYDEASDRLGDFTTSSRVVSLALIGIAIGVFSGFVALALLKLIGLFTNLFFFQRWDTALVSPADNTLGLLEVFVPVVGALIIGLMARYGSERIRGHGIPDGIVERHRRRRPMLYHRAGTTLSYGAAPGVYRPCRPAGVCAGRTARRGALGPLDPIGLCR